MPDESIAKLPSLEIGLRMAERISLALHHNAVPVLRELLVMNSSDGAVENLELRMETAPAFISARVWNIARIDAGQVFTVRELDFTLDPAMLSSLTECEPAKATFILSSGGAEIARLERPIELLPRTQWGGIGYAPELICSFIRPNDPAIDTILKKAATLLSDAGKNAALNGYASKKKERAWELAEAIWNAVFSLKLDYALPPASFETTGQKIRSSSSILEGGIATCLDLTVLFCAALEQCGLNSVIIMKKGHAYPGVWLADMSFPSMITDDASSIRNRIKLQELVLFESTLVVDRRNRPSFRAACEHGRNQLLIDQDDDFELLIDVKVARSQKIRPLGDMDTPVLVSTQAEGNVEGADLAFEAPPFFEEIVDRDPVELVETPKTRLDRWQRKLLDLSLRNTLLNFKAVKRSVTLIAPDPAGLEDVIAAGTELRVLPDPAVMAGSDPRDAELHRQRHLENAVAENAIAALKRGDVFTTHKADELDGRLTELYRSARLSMEEGGANTLHLALGFLAWKKDDKDEKRYKAPLILIPVTLKRKSVKSGFKLVIHEDEPKFNPTLLEMLRQDFNLSIPEVEGEELPKDHSGLDVPRIWKAVSQAVKEIKGWEVEESVVLSTFSFAKFLMWKDLVDRTEQLRQSPIVKHLIDTPREPFNANDGTFPDPRRLDTDHAPETVFCPLPADSSQLSAVMAAARGKNFVLEGPPGTGKSQTISNLIAHTIASGKTILFVSEKMAALDVVYRRLKEVGLGEFCLEIHSAKAKKSDVLDSLRRSWLARGTNNEAEWRKEAARLKGLRDGLNTFVSHLHQPHKCGFSIFSAIGAVTSNADLPQLSVGWPSNDFHTEADMDRLRDIVKRLGINARAVSAVRSNPLTFIRGHEWSNAWQAEMVAHARKMIPAIGAALNAIGNFISNLGVEPQVLSRTARTVLKTLAGTLPQAAGHDWRFVFAPDARKIGDRLIEAADLVEQHRNEKKKLSVSYTAEATASLNLEEIQSEWRLAEEGWFVKKMLGQSSVRKKLLSCAENKKAKPHCLEDIVVLISMKEIETRLQSYDDLVAKTAGLWNGLKTDLDECRRYKAFSTDLFAALGGLATDSTKLSVWRSKIETLLGPDNLLLEPTGQVGASASTLVRIADELDKVEQEFIRLSSSSEELLDASGQTLQDQASLCSRLIELEPKINSWCAWQKVRHEAINEGLAPIVEALEAQIVTPEQVEDAFETAYCRWWLRGAIDADNILRSFVSVEHEQRIQEFKALDVKFTSLTRDYIRANLCGQLPDQDAQSRSAEWGTLKREIEKKRMHLPIRELVRRLPTALTKLSPCLLMSPLSVAQFLPADVAQFDLVVFDEASQIPVWDAIGAIARGKQCVIVGDPKQLPPTSFFDRAETQEDDDEATEADLESILDECLGASLPTLSLSWHYRSRHESLIAFSNHHYYGGGLVTFPSPVTEDRAVSFHFVEDGLYEKGGARINQSEAKAMVSHLVSQLRQPDFKAAGLTIGIVTLNSEQQRLVEDLLDAERRNDPELEHYFSEEALEPVFVKNLESVQGDERDIIYFSIGYGPDRSGHISMNFGPMNRQGGHRRLNVAITRARHGLRVFSSLRADQIDLSRTQASGLRDLKRFLEFAERGAKALAETVHGSLGEYESPFEEAVAKALARKGWRIQTQVGVSAFRIDLGVVHPDLPGCYLAGIECDGATYHRSATARDRDKLREMVLRGLGWKLIRIWSTDWWIDPNGALDKVDQQLRQLLNTDAADAA